MSTLLERFRSRDLQKFTGTFGSAGILTTADGGRYELRSIPREPYVTSQFEGAAVANSDSAAWFITAELPEYGLVDAVWEEAGGRRFEVRSTEPNPRTGVTKVNFKE